jgi:uncharacterized membrane protein YidH (DUF202 family)
MQRRWDPIPALRAEARKEKAMSSHALNETNIAEQERVTDPKRTGWRGVLVGLIPLGLLAGIVAITLLVTALVRELVAGSGFYVQQQTALLALIVSLVLAIVVFAVASWRVLRRVKIWQRDGTTRQANSALWALTATALIIVLPVLLALILPQHPAPWFLGNVYKGVGDFPHSLALAELSPNGFLLVLLDFFGMSNVLRQTCMFILAGSFASYFGRFCLFAQKCKKSSLVDTTANKAGTNCYTFDNIKSRP